MCDAGHAAGRRLRDYGPFGDPTSPKNALLVECGQHWGKSSVTVALETALRFLLNLEMIAPEFAAPHLAQKPLPKQKIIEVTGPVTIASNSFRFAEPFVGLEVVKKAGTLIGWDADIEIRTPYDDCVMVMPSRRLVRGQTAVRFGRFIE